MTSRVFLNIIDCACATIFRNPSLLVKRYAWPSQELKIRGRGGHVLLGGDNVPPPLGEIGLTDLSKSGGEHVPPRPPRLQQACT